MPIDVSWVDAEKSLIQLDFKKPYITTWDEYHDAVEQAYVLAESVDHPVAVVFFAYDATMPPGAPLVHLKHAINNVPDNVVTAVSALDRNPFERMMMNIVQKLTRTKIQTYMVSTPEEALKLARKKLSEATSGAASR